ncbi:MerR family transcriptional regulator [Dysosmobacter sp.]|uniref:MerR family transcriptional regulator n=1 Tax=Dysosmobacter sp. TaxID=2591382 RepID=UPI002A933051|nr:MerR family transcriptional regulator [Dysosmobacter sp.]MCI6055541.1 MerR family transcriptional regulator [Dysosmobacter sp.]MDY5510632.1 MerR family transcriptional regulator [Dysosmobacter sp.]
MTSKEIELRSGVPRANIRYYEAEGLLSPQRAKNGYREYSEKDLETLEKIKLLRRLGVSVEELRQLRQGTEDLSDVLDRRLAELGGEQASLERVRQVCGAVRSAGVGFDALDAGKYLRDLDAPALPEESGGTWWRQPEAPPLPAADTLPTVCSIPRRLFARMLDQFFLAMVLLTALCLLGQNPAQLNDLAVNLGLAVLLALVEPLLLRLFGTTPGKALMGLHLARSDGGRLSWSDGFTRYLMMLWCGLGFGLPIWSLIQMYRTVRRCLDEEPQPWDADIAYTARPFRLRNLAATAAALALVIGVGEAVNSAALMPPNRGDLTVAEFAENFNRQAAYLGMDFGGELDSQGVFQERPEEPNVIRVSVGQEIPGADQFRYTVEDGRLTAVTLSGEVWNSFDWYSLPEYRMAAVLAAFAWAREDAPFWTSEKKRQLAVFDELDWDRGFTLRQGDVTMTLETEMDGFSATTMGIAFPDTKGGENHFAFTFTMALEE